MKHLEQNMKKTALPGLKEANPPWLGEENADAICQDRGELELLRLLRTLPADARRHIAERIARAAHPQAHGWGPPDLLSN
jgi:hypothetical protein